MMNRGEKTIILEYGSHSLKAGLSSDPEPVVQRMLIAHRITNAGNDKLHLPLNVDAGAMG
jgi:hypothetical protein